MANTYFKHRSLHNYTRGGKGVTRSGGKEHDRSGAGEEGYAAICAGVRMGRGMGRSLSDHLCKVKLVGACIKRKGVVVMIRIRS